MGHANTSEVTDRRFAVWPPGWPLPMSATASALRWEDLVELYLAYCESAWGPAADPSPADEETRPARDLAA
jgi:hypothetical protein